MKKYILSTILVFSFSTPAFASGLIENKFWALALQLSYIFQISPTQPVAIFLGNTDVISVVQVSPLVTREEVAYDFFLYPTDEDTLQIIGPSSAYLGCKATIEFTQQETPSKVPDFEANILQHSCEQSLLRTNPVTPVAPTAP